MITKTLRNAALTSPAKSQSKSKRLNVVFIPTFSKVTSREDLFVGSHGPQNGTIAPEAEMGIKQFAERYRLKLVRDRFDDTAVIIGKGGQIYEYSDDELGLMSITPVSKPARTHFWRKMSAQCVAAGMTMRQRGDAEGVLSFDPLSPEHVRLAMKLAGVRARRQLSAEHRAKLLAAGQSTRLKPRDMGSKWRVIDLETRARRCMGVCATQAARTRLTFGRFDGSFEVITR